MRRTRETLVLRQAYHIPWEEKVKVNMVKLAQGDCSNFGEDLKLRARLTKATTLSKHTITGSVSQTTQIIGFCQRNRKAIREATMLQSPEMSTMAFLQALKCSMSLQKCMKLIKSILKKAGKLRLLETLGV